LERWFEWFDVIYRVCVILIPFLVAAAVLWLRANFIAISRFAQVEEDVTNLGGEMSLIKLQIQQLADNDQEPPTRLTLLEQLSALTERLSRLEAANESDRRMALQQFHALERQLSTNNQYLHTIVDKMMPGSQP
jgi:ABC-type uncharacterized transport system fused permease/ATPase subunit